MVIKWGRNGHFLACSGYPECRNTKEFTRNADGSLTVVPTTRPSRPEQCPTCGSPMVIKRGRFGEFLACSRYPECKTTSPISLGVDCPKPGLRRLPDREALAPGQGVLRLRELLARPSATSSRGIARCRSPARSAAPSSSSQKVSKAGVRIRCINEGCDYTADPEAHEGTEARRAVEPRRRARRAPRRPPTAQPRPGCLAR